MTLTPNDLGRRVRYHGPSEPHLCFDDHFRLKELPPHGSPTANGGVYVGSWAICDDGCGRLLSIPCALLSPVSEDCWCDACLTH